jgi:hypothetical protein
MTIEEAYSTLRKALPEATDLTVDIWTDWRKRRPAGEQTQFIYSVFAWVGEKQFSCSQYEDLGRAVGDVILAATAASPVPPIEALAEIDRQLASVKG